MPGREAGGESGAVSWLDRAAERFADADAIAWSGGRWSWGELAARAATTARALEHMAVGPGDTVALLAENGPAWARWLHAAAWRGATLLPLNARLTPDELLFQLEDADVRACIVGEGIDAACVEALRARVGARPLHRIDAVGALEGERASADGAGHDGLALASDDPERTLALLYTSGTTGRPKGVRLPVRAFDASARASQHLVPLGRGDRWLVCMPLFHVGGLSILVRTALAGATSMSRPWRGPSSAST